MHRSSRWCGALRKYTLTFWGHGFVINDFVHQVIDNYLVTFATDLYQECRLIFAFVSSISVIPPTVKFTRAKWNNRSMYWRLEQACFDAVSDALRCVVITAYHLVTKILKYKM